MAFGKMAEVNGTFFEFTTVTLPRQALPRTHIGHAAEFKPGQKSYSPRQAAKYEYGDIRTYNIIEKF